MSATTDTVVTQTVAAVAPTLGPTAPAMAKPFEVRGPPARRMSLALRIFLLLAVLLSLAVGGAMLVSYQRGAAITEEALQRTLESSAALQAEFTERRLEEIQLKSQLLAADAAFVNYITDAQGDLLGLGDDTRTTAGAFSIQDLLLERQASLDFDLGMVLDAEGEVLARTDQLEAVRQNLAGDPLVRDALALLEPLSDFWRMDDVLYQAAILPLAQGNDLVGFVLLAKPVDNILAERVGRISQADVAYLLPQGEQIRIVASSLNDSERAALGRQLADDATLGTAIRQAQAMPRVALMLGDEPWVGRLMQLSVDGGGDLGAALVLSSSERAAVGYRAILNSVVWAGLLALIIALPLSLLLARLSLRPLAAMARAAKAAAAGDYQAKFILGGNDELAQLSQSFDSLLSDLRGERDIESFVSHMSRLLPEPGEEIISPATAITEVIPLRSECLLLAIEHRSLPRELAQTSAAETLDALSSWRGRLQDIADLLGGECVAATGSRLLFAFSGPPRAAQALGLLQAIWAQTPAIAASLAEGSVVIGSMSHGTSGGPVAFGVACQQTDQLLPDAPAGHGLLPRTLGDVLKTEFGEAALIVTKGSTSGKAFYALTAATLASLPFLPSVPVARGTISGSTTRVHDSAPTHRRDQDLRPGTRFGGRYQILSLLGTGGMGVVYRARDLELDDVVALKMLKPAALQDSEHLDRLKSEIRLARRITHPNVLRTFDFGEHAGLPYISMEYVRGMTLRFLIEQTGRVPYTAALRIARQLCAGLQAAHEVGVLHRDIKPENLILEASGNAKLMDFGIARPIRRVTPGTTEPGTFVGTPHYSAPEQLAGKDVDMRADVYACGVLMCEMFCGHLPYTGPNPMDIYMAQMHEGPTPPSAHWADIPPPLEALILRCIATDPGSRYPDVATLAADLGMLRS